MARNVMLIAVDFSDCSRAALDVGIDLAKGLGHSIVLVHSFPRRHHASMIAGEDAQEVFDAADREVQEKERKRLTTEFAQRARKEGLEVEAIAREGPAVHAILEEAERHDVAMIIVGKHGWTGFRRLVLGSIAEDLVRASERPVLTVPKPDA